MDIKITKVSDADFTEKVLESDKPAVVDFWATWCQPCKRLDVLLEKMAHEYDGKVSFFKIDVNESNSTASRYAVRSIPMLLFFDGGEVVDQAVGALSEETLEEKLSRIVKSA